MIRVHSLSAMITLKIEKVRKIPRIGIILYW